MQQQNDPAEESLNLANQTDVEKVPEEDENKKEDENEYFSSEVRRDIENEEILVDNISPRQQNDNPPLQQQDTMIALDEPVIKQTEEIAPVELDEDKPTE